MPRDTRYKAVKAMIDTNGFKTFKDIFEIIPKSVVAADLGIHYNRFLEKINRPAQFALGDLVALAKLIDTAPISLIELALVTPDTKRRKVKPA